MLNGNLFAKILAFAFPLMLTGILQLLFNAADIVIVGQFVGDNALAAVGATASIVNFFVNIFMGLSIGTNYLVAKAYGAGDFPKIRRTVQTSIYTSALLGIVVALIGFFFAEPILVLMNTPAEVVSIAATYLKIYFLGMPLLLIFNYAASILRAVGDTRRPLYFLTIAGVANLILNIVFTVFFRMGVAGVALATVITEALATVLIMSSLIRTKACYKFYPKEIKIYKKELLEMLKVGLPAAVNGSLFSVSNMIIQSSINSFGATIVAGSAVSTSVEGFIFTAMDSIYHATLAFTGQNYGARQYDRLKKVLHNSILIVSILGIGLGIVCLAMGDILFGVFTKSSEVIEAAKIRAWVIIPTYFMCGIMNVYVGSVRGYGYPLLPTFVSAFGILAIRVTWIFTVFYYYHDIRLLFMSWGVSYIVVIAIFIVCHRIIHARLMKRTAIELSFAPA